VTHGANCARCECSPRGEGASLIVFPGLMAIADGVIDSAWPLLCRYCRKTFFSAGAKDIFQDRFQSGILQTLTESYRLRLITSWYADTATNRKDCCRGSCLAVGGGRGGSRPPGQGRRWFRSSSWRPAAFGQALKMVRRRGAVSLVGLRRGSFKRPSSMLPLTT
jgi:hypothetical protein